MLERLSYIEIRTHIAILILKRQWNLVVPKMYSPVAQIIKQSNSSNIFGGLMIPHTFKLIYTNFDIF